MDCQETRSNVRHCGLRELRDGRHPGLKAHLMECSRCEDVFLEKVSGAVFRGMQALRREDSESGTASSQIEDESPLNSHSIACAAEYPTGIANIEHDERNIETTIGGKMPENGSICCMSGLDLDVGLPERFGSDRDFPRDTERAFDEFCEVHGLDCGGRKQLVRAWWQGLAASISTNTLDDCCHWAVPTDSSGITGLLERARIGTACQEDPVWVAIRGQAEQIASFLKPICCRETAIGDGFREAMSHWHACQIGSNGERPKPTREEYECVRHALASERWATAQRDGNMAAINQVGREILTKVHANLNEPPTVHSVPELERVIERWSTSFLLGAHCMPSQRQRAAA